MAKKSNSQLVFPVVRVADKQARQAAREARRRRGGRPRKPAGERGVPHARRPAHSFRHPVHVTVRLAPGMPSLRGRPVFKTVQKVLRSASARFGQMFRIVEYSVQSNHVHLVVEAQNRRELSRGMQGFGIRLAKNVNLRLRRKGAVFQDRYHAHPLKSPAETLSALRYVRQNTHLHRWRNRERASWNPDPCSTDHVEARAVMPLPRTPLLAAARSAFS